VHSRSELRADCQWLLTGSGHAERSELGAVCGSPPVSDHALASDAAAQFLAERGIETEPDGFADGEFFEFLLGRCLLTKTTGHDDWHPQHAIWAA
jgi:hypothetical protein